MSTISIPNPTTTNLPINELPLSGTRTELPKVVVTPHQIAVKSKQARSLLVSCTLSGGLFLSTLALGIAESTGAAHIIHPLFCFPFSVASLGVFGSTLISLRRLVNE